MMLAAGHGHWSVRDTILPRINDVVVFTFFAVCGGSVGSFLNVVVWRMPQGLSVNGHSFCPRCQNQLRARDNVPVFGWLWLGGRCRACRLPISSRYPIVEAALAITFAFVGTLELYGWNLPYRPYPFRHAMTMPVISPESTIAVLYHLVGLAIAWAMGLIRYDRNAIPMRLVTFAGIWLIGAMVLMPSLGIVPWQLTVPEDWASSLDPYSSLGWGQIVVQNFSDSDAFVQALVRVATALVAAGFFARVLARAFCPEADLKTDPLSGQTRRLLDLVGMISVVALIVGWQSTSGVVLAASVLGCLVTRWLAQKTPKAPASTDAMGRFSLMLPVALTLQLLFWRPLMEWGYWPSAPALPSTPALSSAPAWSNIPVGIDSASESQTPSGFESLGIGSTRGTILWFALATLFIPLWIREPKPTQSDAAIDDAIDDDDDDEDIDDDDEHEVDDGEEDSHPTNTSSDEPPVHESPPDQVN